MFFEQTLNGITLGATYALVGAGFSLTMGVLGILNLALGEVFMVGAFLALTLVVAGLPFPVALVAGGIAGGALNLLVGRVTFRERGSDPLFTLVGSLAVSAILQTAATNLWGTDQYTFPSPFAQDVVPLGPVEVSLPRVAILGAAGLVFLSLDWFLQRTRPGREVRAVAESPDVARLLGVNPVGVLRLVFMVSGGLAAGSGILVGLAFGQITPFMGVDVGLKGIAAMVLGGMGNVRATVGGGMLLGLLEVYSVAYVSSSYRDVVVYAGLILTLLLRPQGLFGRMSVERV